MSGGWGRFLQTTQQWVLSIVLDLGTQTPKLLPLFPYLAAMNFILFLNSERRFQASWVVSPRLCRSSRWGHFIRDSEARSNMTNSALWLKRASLASLYMMKLESLFRNSRKKFCKSHLILNSGHQEREVILFHRSFSWTKNCSSPRCLREQIR